MKKIKLITTLIYTLALAYFSLVPVPREFSETVKVNDIVQHFVAYFTLTFLWYLYWRKIKYSSILSLTVGLLTELIQLTVPYRVFSSIDLVANTAGVLLFTIFTAGVKWYPSLLKSRVSGSYVRRE